MCMEDFMYGLVLGLPLGMCVLFLVSFVMLCGLKPVKP